jgi:mannosyltransferase OCH1-like enzyme
VRPHYEDWWERNLPARLAEFEHWVGDARAPTRRKIAAYVAQTRSKTVLDCGASLCIEEAELTACGASYTALDPTPYFVERARRRGLDILDATVHAIPLPDDSRDLVYCRHLLEHVDQHGQAIDEMLRVASRATVLVFFLPPRASAADPCIDLAEQLRVNQYDLRTIDDRVRRCPKVRRLAWEVVGSEAILFIELAGAPPSRVTIPKVFHRIWLGAPMPDEFRRFGEGWQRLHPDWEMKLWDESTLPALIRQEAYDACTHPVQKADIASYELLHRFGGVYLDCDFECLQSLEPLLAGVDAFAGSEEAHVVSHGILGGPAGHPLWRRIIDAIPESVATHRNMSAQTGPAFLTRVVAGDLGLTVFHPALFYPYLHSERERRFEVFPYAYAAHHWASSWW